MTNKDLITIFELAEASSDNIFDVYEALEEHADAYNEMSIANIILTIYDAYELYCSHKNKGKDILNAIVNADFSSIIEQFDLGKLFDQIPEEYQSLMKQLIQENSLNS